MGVAEYYSEYKQCFEGAGTDPGEKTLEDKFFEEEVRLNKNAFMQQFHFGVFFRGYFLCPLRNNFPLCDTNHAPHSPGCALGNTSHLFTLPSGLRSPPCCLELCPEYRDG